MKKTKKDKNIDMRILLHPAVWSIFLLLGALEYIGSRYSLFETIWWYDILLHGLGGFWLGILIIKAQRTAKNILFILIAVFVMGLAWEIYEKAFDVFLGPILEMGPFSVSIADTGGDLIMDMLGAGASVLVLRLRSRFLR
jgi:uncharacterized membrane protein